LSPNFPRPKFPPVQAITDQPNSNELPARQNPDAGRSETNEPRCILPEESFNLTERSFTSADAPFIPAARSFTLTERSFNLAGWSFTLTEGSFNLTETSFNLTEGSFTFGGRLSLQNKTGCSE
jgi:hypothetical protein